jgi:hypothetical protein
LAIFGAGSTEGCAAGADDFCGGALGEVVVNVGGGALKGNAFAIGWSAASAGSAGGYGLGAPIALFGVGGVPAEHFANFASFGFEEHAMLHGLERSLVRLVMYDLGQKS